MLLDQPTPSFAGDVKIRFVDGYAGFRSSARAVKQGERTETPYSPRISAWMRKKIEVLVIARQMTNPAIAKQLGVSRGQVNYTSRRLFLREPGRQHKP